MLDEKDEFLLDEISGRKRKPVMSLLNKKKLSKHELDELFVGFGSSDAAE